MISYCYHTSLVFGREKFTVHTGPVPRGGGGGVSELMDRRKRAILSLDVVPKNLIFAQKSYPEIYFTIFHACYFSKENYASPIYQVKNG